MTDKELLVQKLSEKIKEAGPGSWASRLWGGIKNSGRIATPALQKGLGYGAAGLILGGGAALASVGAQAISDPLKKRVGRNRMYRENAFLHNEDKKTVNKYYNTLYRFSPTMAMDPLVAGSFMKKQLEFKDVGIQPTDVGTLANIEKAVRDRRDGGILSSTFAPVGLKDTGSMADSGRRHGGDDFGMDTFV